MTAEEIRQGFLKFFEEKGHKIIPSSSLVPKGDPTLLFTSAGMVQFKPYYLGLAEPPCPRLASCQRCFRVTDIDSVGDATHLTFFEMLGNFSIGDYFKKEAIAWAWEFVTERLKLPEDRLRITVFRDDEEAFGIWRALGVPAEKISRMDEKDNFWGPAGDSGPCGPCSEIHYDFGENTGCGRPECGPGCSCSRFSEIWNLVFVQFNQDKQGKRTRLERCHIDTGMGLERISAIMQGKKSVYQTDLLAPLVERVTALSGKEYGKDSDTDNAIRIVAEHGRGIAFLIADGVLPGNEKQAYVLRRLMRRTIFFGEKLAAGRPFLTEVAKLTIKRMQHEYPELGQREGFILQVIKEEEARFRDTLKTGLQILENMMAEAGTREISGEAAFKLYDTYGFPVDLTCEIARRRGFLVDVEGFEREMKRQRERAKASHTFKTAAGLKAGAGAGHKASTKFVGYEMLEYKSAITEMLVDDKPVKEIAEGQKAGLVLKETPFYAEMGGQVGDTGQITGPSGRFIVTDTVQSVPGVTLHQGYVAEGRFAVGNEVTAAVDEERRLDIARNHTATHLLQNALRRVLGEHVQQRGSLVAPDRLRFDFSHILPMTEDEIEQVQAIVNQEIRRNHPVRPELMPYKEAIKGGVIALFGEKYGEEVRVLRIGQPVVSAELCGGTHVSATGQIGFFRILSETGIGGGLRRIEAATGRGAEKAIGDAIDELKNQVAGIQAELDKERKRTQALEQKLARQEALSLLEKAETINGVRLLVSRVSAEDADIVRGMTDTLRDKLGSGVVVLGAVIDGRPSFTVAVTPDLVKKGFHAGNIVKKLAQAAGGGGGGRPDIAQGGGKDKDKLDYALGLAKSLV